MLDKLPEDIVYEQTILDRVDVNTRTKLTIVSKSCRALALANWLNLNVTAQKTDAACHEAFEISRMQSRDSIDSLSIKSSFLWRVNIIGNPVL